MMFLKSILIITFFAQLQSCKTQQNLSTKMDIARSNDLKAINLNSINTDKQYLSNKYAYNSIKLAEGYQYASEHIASSLLGGKGVDVMVIESKAYLTTQDILFKHTQVQDRIKAIYDQDGNKTTYTDINNWNIFTDNQKTAIEHANMVMSILAGSRSGDFTASASSSGSGMQGVAFNSNLIFSRASFKPLLTEDKVRVVNMSFGSELNEAKEYDALDFNTKDLFVNQVLSYNRLFVQSAGNDRLLSSAASVNPNSMAAMAKDINNNEANLGAFLAVVATNNAGTDIASYSNLCGDSKQWCLAAPGGDSDARLYVASNYRVNGVTKALEQQENGFDYAAGTSLSAPIISGVAANVMTLFPEIKARDVASFILKYANPRYDSKDSITNANKRIQGQIGNSINLSNSFGYGIVDFFATLKGINTSSPYGYDVSSTLNANLSNTAMMASGVMGGGSGSGSGGYGGGIAGLVNAASKAVFVDAFGYAFDNNLAFKLNFNNGLGGRVNAYSNAVTYNTLSGYTNSYNSFFTSATSAAQGLGGFASTTSFGGYAGLSGYSGYSTTGRGFSANYLDGEFNLNSSSNSSGLGSSSKSSSNSLFASFANFITSFSGSSSFGSGMNFGLDGSYGQNQQSSFGFNLNPASLNSINIGTDLNFNSFANRFTSSDNNIYSLNSNSGLKAFGDSLGAGSGIVGGLAGNGSTSFIKGNANSYSASNASLGLSYFTNTKNSFINPLLYSSALSSTGYGFVSGANNANPLNSNFISSSLANLNLGLGSLGMGLGGSYYNQASLINFNQNPLVRGFAGLGSGSNLSNPFNATNNATQSFNFALGDYSLAYSKNALIQNTSSLASALFQGFSNQSYKLGFKTSTKSALNLSYSNIKPFTQSLGIAEFNNSSNNSNNSNNSANFGARLIEASFTHSPNKKLAYDVKLGFVNETHSFLANLVSGAFSVNGAKTGFVEFLFHHNLTSKTAFDFGTSLGLTKVSTISGLLFDSFTTLFTNSASLRLTKYGVFFNGSSGNSGNGGNSGSSNNYSSGFKTSDSISISLSAPTAITSGSVRIRSMNSLSQASISTTNKTRQLDTGLAYKLSLSSNNSAAYIKGLNSITSHKISSHKPFTAAELSLGITHSQNYHHTPNLSVNTLFIGVGVGG
jgi:hypothetical protein